MSTYLATLSLGPVQSLIEAARRTRDLWCGSWLLAESAKAAALVLYEHDPQCLVFPWRTPLGELLASLQPTRDFTDGEANIANILRAELKAENDAMVRDLLAQAKAQAAARLAGLCEQARKRLGGLPLHEDLWQRQTGDLLEGFAAWVEVGPGPDGYQEASRRLGRLLAARKATRDFAPAGQAANDAGAGVPKSSLDGARESVINLPRGSRKNAAYKPLLRRLGLDGGEELDALGVTKRVASTNEQFTAYSRVAADPWVRQLQADDKGQGAALCRALGAAYDRLVEPGLATRVKGNGNAYAALPYDAQLLFGFRLDNALASADALDHEALKPLRQVLHDIKAAGHKEPVPYAVILKADGDRMGALLNRASSAEQSRAVSVALHGFALRVRGMVREHHGHAIYAGGDDVLALLPLDRAVAAARALALDFETAMKKVARELGAPPGEQPTLSVGLGIGHLMDPLGRLRARADRAEKDAKGDGYPGERNALAIRLGVRSGAERSWRGRWDDAPAQAALDQFVQAYRDRDHPCPSRLGYELEDIARRLAWAKEAGVPLPAIHEAELTRTLAQARLRGGGDRLSKDFQERLRTRAGQVGLAQLADELIIARWLSARTLTEIGERP